MKGQVGQPSGWIENEDWSALWRVGRLGTLVVRKVRAEKRRGELRSELTNYEVVVFGTGLKERSENMEDGKERAIAAARMWVTEAHRKLEIGPNVTRHRQPERQGSARAGGTNS